MKETLAEIEQLRTLIKNAEVAIQKIETLVPKNHTTWLSWRVRGLENKLAEAKRDLQKVIEQTQIQLFEKAINEDNRKRIMGWITAFPVAEFVSRLL